MEVERPRAFTVRSAYPTARSSSPYENEKDNTGMNSLTSHLRPRSERINWSFSLSSLLMLSLDDPLYAHPRKALPTHRPRTITRHPSYGRVIFHKDRLSSYQSSPVGMHHFDMSTYFPTCMRRPFVTPPLSLSSGVLREFLSIYVNHT